MDFQFSEKEEQFRSDIRAFVKENLPKDHFGHKFEEEHDDEAWEFGMSIAKKLAQKKWLTISWPKEFGGIGASYKEQMIFKEEVGYWGIPGTRMGVSGTGWVGPSIMLFGSREQQEKYLPAIAAAEPDGVWCTGYSEPDSGSDLASLQTRAEKKGDHYILNGQKVWTSAAHRARYCWLAARTNTEVAKKHHGLSLFIIDLKSKGVTIRPLKNFAGFHVFNEIFFNDVEIPAENLVGQENNGWRHLMQALSFERGTAIEYCGILRRVLDEMVQYAKANGLIKKTLVRHNLAELAINLEAARMLAYEADWKRNNNMSRTYEPSRDKANTDMLFERLTRFGMNLMNANAMIDPLCKKSKWTQINGMVEHLYYMCPGMALAAGTTFTQKNIVGQFGLQLPRAY